MDIYRAERIAQDWAVEGPNWNKSFKLVGPSGEIECEWLDPYFGLFRMKDSDGFIRTKDIPSDLDVVMPDHPFVVADQR